MATVGTPSVLRRSRTSSTRCAARNNHLRGSPRSTPATIAIPMKTCSCPARLAGIQATSRDTGCKRAPRVGAPGVRCSPRYRQLLLVRWGRLAVKQPLMHRHPKHLNYAPRCAGAGGVKEVRRTHEATGIRPRNGRRDEGVLPTSFRGKRDGLSDGENEERTRRACPDGRTRSGQRQISMTKSKPTGEVAMRLQPVARCG